ncbi:hypothetical protein [Shewanella fidelis]|uniref:Uncharacterized protein n=1 Tax=Shewanella fidelis TaxID=173509 RepID=A0AAW8NNY1_9GAMM|nr:hypothetical protein [Shewanella fidelis]MDR8523638.1 hypothetical protein [Shewanella fidelis]MDW4810185.1 hypothetical protein [Shewanella fidelis]MDW4814330.1 hypothetical protein [Shewanella fidelis]MDW4818421.1 hypothetical protein [Shewanella fidelis]MDW4823927.1 hypothetical protein [Shewanella fidelis]
MQDLAPLIDIPFAHRHTCWFCGEPSNQQFSYIKQTHTPHSSLSVPCCNECLKLAKAHRLTSIWDCKMAVKDELMRIYEKHLAIGVNWTQQELEESGFEDDDKIFGGFKKSAWMMYEIARDRVNYKGWPLSLNGILVEDYGYDAHFSFDGVNYRSVSQAIGFYAKQQTLDKRFLEDIIAIVGKQHFGFAVRVAQINIAAVPEMKKQVLQDLAAEQVS